MKRKLAIAGLIIASLIGWYLVLTIAGPYELISIGTFKIVWR